MMEAQTSSMCQLCEYDSKLRWKCLECGLLMCERCQDKVHPKFASAEKHTVIDIKEVRTNKTGPKPRLDLASAKCNIHHGEYIRAFCKTCQRLVCFKCIQRTYITHNINYNLDNEYDTKLEKIKTIREEVKTGMPSLVKRQEELIKIKFIGHSNYDMLKQEILYNNEALINDIKEHTDKLFKELDQKWEPESKSIEEEEKNVQVKKGQIQQQNQEINEILQSDNAFSVPDSLLELRMSDLASDDTSWYKIPKFIQGDRKSLSLILGKLDYHDYVIPGKLENDTNKYKPKKNSCIIL